MALLCGPYLETRLELGVESVCAACALTLRQHVAVDQQFRALRQAQVTLPGKEELKDQFNY
jgi:hypothetical protein